jgi:hypothetical protein
MAQSMVTPGAGTTAVADLFGGLGRSYRLSLMAMNRSPKTLETYLQAVIQFDAYLVDRGMPTSVTGRR